MSTQHSFSLAFFFGVCSILMLPWPTHIRAGDPLYCQPFDDTLLATPGIWIDEVFSADDFVADGTTLSHVTVWGFYVIEYESGGCAPPLTYDHFHVRVYENDSVTGRQPGSEFAQSLATSQLFAIPGSQVEANSGLVMYRIELDLASPVNGLIAGNTYWLEVSNELTNIYGQPVDCVWLWSVKNQTAASYYWFSYPRSCPPGYARPYDLAFCLDAALGESPVGGMAGACCTCDGVCSERTLDECDQAGGHWDINRTTCAGVVCPLTPANDNCVDGPPLVGEGQYAIAKDCATTDGYGPIPTDTGQWQIEGDVWYKFIAPPNCALRIDTCWTDATCFDSMLAVYHNPDDPSVCPPCALLSDPGGGGLSSATLAGMGQDENCGGGGVSPSNGLWIDTDQLGRNALPGECFLIRVGNFPGGPRAVEGTLTIDCADIPPALEPDPSGINKVRFISLQIPPESTTPTAIRVQMTTLLRVVPCYIECPPSFRPFDGQHVWVGPPVQYVESAATGTTFLASVVQCTPYYQDWSTVGLLHVTGTGIVPSSTYHVEQVAIACQGREDDPDCAPGGANVSSQLEIKTTRWGDVEQPYNPPSPTAQPDLADVGALVNKFRNAPGAPIKARALLIGKDGFGTMDIAEEFNFTHIAACVNAFRGQNYPHKIGRCSVGGSPCTINSDCTEAGGAGPCTLYCP